LAGFPLLSALRSSDTTVWLWTATDAKVVGTAGVAEPSAAPGIETKDRVDG